MVDNTDVKGPARLIPQRWPECVNCGREHPPLPWCVTCGHHHPPDARHKGQPRDKVCAAAGCQKSCVKLAGGWAIWCREHYEAFEARMKAAAQAEDTGRGMGRADARLD